MKKLMTSLLAVLLCGIGFLWADGVKVSGTVKNSSVSYWDSDAAVTLTPAFGNAQTVELTRTTNQDYSFTWSYEFENVTAGNYTLSFRGMENGIIYTSSQNITVSSENLEQQTISPLPTGLQVTVEVGYAITAYPFFKPIEDAQVSYKAKDTEGDATTRTTAPNGKVFFEIPYNTESAQTYIITVKANGYTDKTEEVDFSTSNTTKKITMDVIAVTVSGTLTWGTETISAFPENMGLAILIDEVKYTPTLSAEGYSVTGKAGKAQVYVTTTTSSDGSYNSTVGAYVSEAYGVTEPANGSFTISLGENNTMTQNLTVKKIATTVTVPVNANDNLSPYDLNLTTADGKTIQASRSLSTTTSFVYQGVPAGTHTLVLDKFGYKIKDNLAIVTVNESLDEVTTPTLEIEAGPTPVAVSGVAQYRDKTNTTHDSRGELVNLSGATVTLYAAKSEESGSYVPDGEAVGTATVAEDGTFSFTASVTKIGYHIATLTHEAIRPSLSSTAYIYNANAQTIDFSGSINMIWISGEVTNHADLSNVELKWTGENTYSLTFKSEYDPTTGKYYAYVPGAAPVPGTYTLNLRATNSEGLLMVASEEVTVAADKKAVTQDLTATQDPNSGLMTVTYKYKAAKKEITVADLGVTVLLNNGSEEGEWLAELTTDANGVVKYVVDKDKTYTLKTLELPKLGYAATKVNVNGFVTVGDISQPNDTTIFLEALPIAAWIKLTGSVTLPGGVAKLSDLGEDLYIAVQTMRDLDVMSEPIKNDNTYTIDSIPVIKKQESGAMPLFLAQTGGKPNAYGVEVPYNYDLDVTSYNTFVEQDYTTNTLNVNIRKIACNVSGSVSPAKTGEATLTKQGDEEPTYKANIVGAGTYTFQGVLAGTYTLNVNCAGYAPATRDVTVEATLADVTVPAITLESAPLTVEVGGNLTFTRNDKIYYFEGAELAIYDGDEKLAESTVPEGSMGTFSFTFTSTIGTTVRFTMKHPSIKDVSKEYKVTSDKLTINASDLNYEFIESGNDDYVVMTGFKAEWNADISGLNLSWTWPEGADGKIKKITLRRKLSGETGNGVELTTWEATGDNPHDNSYTFAAAELPVAYADTVTVSTSYAYLFEILYAAGLHRESVWFTADMRDGDRYKLTYTVNDDKMGTISSYMQPEGEYMEGDAITVTATAKPGYKFVEFLKNDQKLTEAELGRITLLGSDRDSVAIFGFNMPAEDLTVKAVFAAKGQAPDVTVEYTVTLVSSNEAWGTVSGAGKFEEGTEIEVKATVTDAAKYKFVAWKEGDKEVSKDATYKFKVEKDITLTAVFEEVTANENLKAARWTIFAEDGAIVIKGINGDRYDIYDLNGRLSGSALCTGAEIRLGVAKSKLYIVRRLGADGSFDAKKIVVR